MAATPQLPPADEPASQPSLAVGKLVFRRPYIMAFIVSMVREFELAEQIFQDLIMHMGESRETPPSGQDQDAWLLALVRRRTMAFLNARASSGQLEPPAELIDRLEVAVRALMASPEERWVQRKEAIRASLQELPTHLAKLLDLRYMKDLPLPAIARGLGKDPAEVAMLLAQTRGLLARGLAKRLGGLA